MNLDQAINYLRKISENGNESRDQFFEAVGLCIRNPQPRAIEVLMGCLAVTDESLACEALQTALARQPEEVLRPQIEQGLKHASAWVRCGCAELARTFPNEAWTEPLLTMLQAGDSIERLSAVSALEKHQSKRVLEALRTALAKEQDRDIHLMIVDVLALAEEGSKTIP